MDRQNIKLSVRISRELPFINAEEIQMFLDEHYWIQENYNKVQKLEIDTIYDDLIEYLESKKERYASLKQIISEEKSKENNELKKYVNIEFKEYNFLMSIDNIRQQLKNNKEQLQKHLQYILQCLDRIIDSNNNNTKQIIIDLDKFTLIKSEEIIKILELFNYRICDEQLKKNITMLECIEPDIQFTLNSIIHMNENLKDELFFDQILIQKEQERQLEIQKKVQNINSFKHKTNLYDFQRKDQIQSQTQSQYNKNQVRQRVQEQINIQIRKSQNPFLSNRNYTLQNAIQNNQTQQQQLQQQQQFINNPQQQQQQQNSQINQINVFSEFEKLSEKDIWKQVNEYRESLGLNKLKWSDEISQICRQHSMNMGQLTISFGHENFPQRREQINQYYKSLKSSSENVFQYYTYLGLAKTALNQWINTSGNDINLRSNSNICGVGAYRNEQGIWYVTLILIEADE